MWKIQRKERYRARKVVFLWLFVRILYRMAIKLAIRINLDLMLAKNKMSSGELAEKVGITQANLSILKTGKAKAVRFSTLEAICRELNCQPGDILEYKED